MSLFTTLTVNDGSEDTTYAYRGPEIDAKRGVRKGVYINPSASPSIASQAIVKHDETSNKFHRHLVQLSEKDPIDTEGTLAAATVNITINHHPNADQGFLDSLYARALALAGQTGVAANLRKGMLS